LLVDVTDRYDPAVPLAGQTGTHFQSLNVVVEYHGSTGEASVLEVNVPDLPPALVQPDI
jgi:hypothetical protein